MHQQAKIQAISSICSRDIVDLKILQSDWLRAFRPVTLEPDFSQIWDLHRNTNTEEIIEEIQKKNYQTFQLIQKTLFFGPFSTSLGQTKFFQKMHVDF